MGVIDFDDALLDLREGVVRVVFEKKDGKVREMYATRNPDLIAEFTVDTMTKVRDNIDSIEKMESMLSQKNTGVIKVFDLYKKEFRAITLRNVFYKDPFEYLPGWIYFDVDGHWQKAMEDEISLADYVKYG